MDFNFNKPPTPNGQGHSGFRLAHEQKLHQARSGCDACQRRKMMCDKGKPECESCRRANLLCTYPVKQEDTKDTNGSTTGFNPGVTPGATPGVTPPVTPSATPSATPGLTAGATVSVTTGDTIGDTVGVILLDNLEHARDAAYQTCVHYFINIAQHSTSVQLLFRRMNKALPFQAAKPTTTWPPQRPVPHFSLLTHLRRLVVTGLDTDQNLLALFGPHWRAGLGQWRRNERRHYLFAAKSMPWLATKQYYDESKAETVPYLIPLQHVYEEEIEEAEDMWVGWLAQEDFMLGPRAPLLAPNARLRDLLYEPEDEVSASARPV